MGLDTTHGCWRGAYSAFGRWREKIAEVAGLPPLGMMEGFWDWQTGHGMALSIRADLDTLRRYAESAHPTAYLDGHGPGEHTRAFFASMKPIRWESLRPDPLHELLNHSDCDGSIPSASCAAIADRLAELLPLMPDGDGGGHIGIWRDKTQEFIAGLRLAASLGEDVEFR